MLNFKKFNFSTKLFVAASLATFILLAAFYIFIKAVFTNTAIEQADSEDKYYLNENYSEGDLLMTKVPNLSDMLAGPIITDLDPNLGEKNALVTIVEFSDFECSFCSQQEQILKQLLTEYQGKVRLIWKDYPENDENSYSWQAALAARCAQQQGKFWQFHDLLFQQKNTIEYKDFINLAVQLDLNKNQFSQCFNNQETAGLIKDNIEEANALDIKGIPFIYINDQEVMGQVTLEELKKMVEIELN